MRFYLDEQKPMAATLLTLPAGLRQFFTSCNEE
jgi:hypothetical protein